MRGIAALASLFFCLMALLAHPTDGGNAPVVDAGDDQQLCTSDMVTVTGLVLGDYLDAKWQIGGVALSDADQLTQTFFLDATAQALLEVRYLADTNLVRNGDFSLGNQDFYGDYDLGTSNNINPLNEGFYAIERNPRDAHNRFAACDDHTDGNGEMMVVNGLGVDSRVWCQTVVVAADADYYFNALVTSVVSQNPADLRFSINGQLLGSDYQVSPITCQWQAFSAEWSADGATQAEICINNTSLTAAGNDFALDDISFRPICIITDTAQLTVLNLDAGFTIPPALCETQPDVAAVDFLDGSATPGGIWTLDGQVITQVLPSMLGPGSYALSYTVTEGSCTESTSATLQILDQLTAGFGHSTDPICEGVDSVIQLANLLTGADTGGNWTDRNTPPLLGNQVDLVAGTVNTIGLPAGVYRFEYTHSSNSPCPTESAQVSIDIAAPPVADAGNDTGLGCILPEVSIGGAGTSQGADYRYTWTTADGGPIQDADQPVARVGAPGMYTLLVEDIQTGCTVTDIVMVDGRAAALIPELLVVSERCAGSADAQIALASVEGGLPPYVFGLEGQVLQMDSVISGLGAGDYRLRVEDAAGCDTTIIVTIAARPPITVTLSPSPGASAELVPGDSLRLVLFNSLDTAETASVVWRPDIDCPDCMSAVVRPLQTTTYTATVTDQMGCEAEARFTVLVDDRIRVYLPNAFSPNNDGVNDVFFVHAASEIANVKSLQIFDRWGGLRYEVRNVAPNDPQLGWEGRSLNGDPAPVGTYVYVVEVETRDGRVVSSGGDVLLLR